MHPDRWEVGSHFHWAGLPQAGEAPHVPWSAGRLLSSGRDALRMALAIGSRTHGWRRLWVPDYFCQHTVSAMAKAGLELQPYPDDPLRGAPDLPDARVGDAILVMNYFGLRSQPRVGPQEGVGLIEDHSHDPTSAWAFASSADFCVASLRKTSPLPDGGVLWSPRGHSLPPAPRQAAQRKRTAATRLEAMVLKALYLDGQPVDKAEFLAMADHAEEELHQPAVSAISPVSRAVLASFPLDAWRRARAANHAVLTGAVAGLAWVRALAPAAGAGSPFSTILVMDTPRRRDRVRERLIEGRVYAAVLWPLESPVVAVRDEARSLGRRLLSIPCDARYDAADMLRVGELLQAMGRH